MAKIGVVGIGRLGLCFALNLERVGFDIYGVDSNAEYIQSIKSKTLESNEPHVESFLEQSEYLNVSTELAFVLDPEIHLIFICVPTPSKADGTFDHSYIDKVCDEILAFDRPKKETHLIINSTVMPGYCDKLHEKMSAHGYSISYNPEFIAQGSIIEDQQFPDQVLIGEANEEIGNEIEAIYRCFVQKEDARFSRMSRTESEITKLAVNCFLTTKIAFANSIGDLTVQHGGNQDKVLDAIGSDSRIGSNFLRYGFGYGGPCLPRDNRAMGEAAKEVNLELPISIATDRSNVLHRNFQREAFEQNYSKDDQITFTGLTYKPNSDIIEESQRLELAVDLAKEGYGVLLRDRAEVIDQIQAIHQDLFMYEVVSDD
ncbi:MAG: nucleotide sugar dehydrogenase [Crocinitomicaceae bacterium]|nr:nucleotide sugar dehydrogenase [Crocinitomicaceae bacterium]